VEELEELYRVFFRETVENYAVFSCNFWPAAVPKSLSIESTVEEK
jgi:hypothetical protein